MIKRETLIGGTGYERAVDLEGISHLDWGRDCAIRDARCHPHGTPAHQGWSTHPRKRRPARRSRCRCIPSSVPSSMVTVSRFEAEKGPIQLSDISTRLNVCLKMHGRWRYRLTNRTDFTTPTPASFAGPSASARLEGQCGRHQDWDLEITFDSKLFPSAPLRR